MADQLISEHSVLFQNSVWANTLAAGSWI